MPQSQGQRGLSRGRDVGKVLNFPIARHSVETMNGGSGKEESTI